MATLGMSADEQQAVEAFRRDVVEPSMDKLVIIDFWAEWCGPCKQLGPVLEKVVAGYASKGVLLAKIDVDANKFVAAQFRVQSIPTVYAMYQGKLVADLTQARTEGQLSQMIDQILRQLQISGEEQEPSADIAPLLAMGEEVLDSGDGQRAFSIFSQIAEMAPEDPAAISGLVRALVLTGQIEDAQALLAELPPEVAKDAAIQRATAAVTLALETGPVEDLSPLRARVESNPDDHEARYELAGGLMAAGDRDGAVDQLLESIGRDREWNEGAAKARLLTLFEAAGLEDKWVSAQRRRLSAVLFT